MAACGAEASGIRYSSARDATCEGGVIGNDGEDRPQGCARACPADPDGLVPSGARQVDGLARGAGIVGCAQAASRAAYRRRIEHSRNRGFGLKVGPVTRKGFEARIRQLVTGQATLERIAAAMLIARATLKTEYEKLH